VRTVVRTIVYNNAPLDEGVEYGSPCHRGTEYHVRRTTVRHSWPAGASRMSVPASTTAISTVSAGIATASSVSTTGTGCHHLRLMLGRVFFNILCRLDGVEKSLGPECRAEKGGVRSMIRRSIAHGSYQRGNGGDDTHMRHERLAYPF
jgi:hypothetical protein